MQGMKENCGMTTNQVTKLADSGLLVFLKGFGTSIFSTCRIPLRQAGHSNLKFVVFLFVCFFKVS